MLVLSLLPQHMLAAEDTPKEQILIQVAEDVEVNDSKGDKLGLLYKNTYLFTTKHLAEDGHTSLQWGENEAIVNNKSLLEAEALVNIQEYNNFEEPQSLGTVRANEEPIPFKDEAGNIVGSIAPGNELTVSKLDDTYFYILVGGRNFIIDRKQFESNFTSNEISDDQIDESVLEEVEENPEGDTSIEETTEGADRELQPVEETIVEETTTEELAEEETPQEEAIEEEQVQEETPLEENTTEEETDNPVEEQQEEAITATSQKMTTAVIQQQTVKPFTKDTKYFKVTEGQLPVYDNRSGSLVLVGYLKQGEVYPRTKDYTSWHQITFGDYYAYVPKEGTIPSEPLIQNEYGSSSLGTGTRTITALKDIEVYDNSSGSLVQYATIKSGVTHTIIKEYTSWYSVLVAGRVGYVRKSDVQLNFFSTDKYFKVVEDKVPVYDNSSGSLVEIGHLKKGEAFPRIKHYTSWHAISFGNKTGYVRISSTTLDNGSGIKNLSNGKTTNVTITARWDSVVYDNTQSSKLVPFAVIKGNTTYKIINEYTSWYAIEIAGRVGYLNKKNAIKSFSTTDKYFKALEDNIPVYDNRSGTLVKVGSLMKEQVYPRTGEDANMHQIQFGDFKAYVPKAETAPDTGSSIKNLNTSYKNTTRTFVALKNVDVMDNTTTPMTKFAEIEEGQSYPIVSESTSWWGILFADRVGYVKKDNALGGIYKEVTYTNYDYTLDQMVEKQMNVNPQTDKYKVQYAYVADYLISIEDRSTYPKTATVIGSSGVNLRSQPNMASWIYNTVLVGKSLTVVEYAGYGWYKVEYPTHIFGGFSAAHESDVREYVDPTNFDLNTKSMYQFVLLSKYAGANPTELNNLLKGKGILEGKGEAFAQGSKLAGINEIYLVSHALLETGNGSSTLANGVPYTDSDGKTYTVYNMFGINATDGNATENASKFAYQEGWFTPEAAIIGGAKFVAERYVYNGYNQDTIYKMRWNPQNPATHQYATDVGWAEKQTTNFMNLYNQLTSYQLYLDIPKYN